MGIGQIHAQLPDWAFDIVERNKKADTVVAPSVSYLDAVQPALYIVRQQYRLERNGDFFGRQNKPYFAETYSLGIKIAGGTILQRKVMFPWENNADYQRVNNGGKYNPVHFKTLQRSINGGDWKAVELEFGTQYIAPFTSDSLLYRHTDATADFGLPIDETTGIKQGYMIWVYSTSNLQDSAMQIKFQQAELKIEAKGSGNSVNVKPDGISNVLGGIFIVPQVERPGYIKLLLSGIAAPKSENEWALKLMTSETSELTVVDKAGESKKQKKKKERSGMDSAPINSPEDIELTPIK